MKYLLLFLIFVGCKSADKRVEKSSPHQGHEVTDTLAGIYYIDSTSGEPPNDSFSVTQLDSTSTFIIWDTPTVWTNRKIVVPKTAYGDVDMVLPYPTKGKRIIYPPTITNDTGYTDTFVIGYPGIIDTSLIYRRDPSPTQWYKLYCDTIDYKKLYDSLLNIKK